MPPALKTMLAPLVNWRGYCLLLIALFLLRGAFVLSVYPPFEGWDEYQHVGYLEYLIEHDAAPVLHEDSFIPTSINDDLVKWPHSPSGAEQLRGIGGVDYDTYWQDGPPAQATPNAPRIHLYQAQHSSFYYRCVLPVYQWTKAQYGLVGAVSALRWINVICGAMAILALLGAVGKLVRPGALRHLLGLAIATQPLFLLNCARVANDGPAIMFAAMASVILIGMQRKTWLRSAILGGGLLGLAIVCKTIHLGLVPLLGFVFLVHALRHCWKQGCAGLIVALVAIAVVSGPYFYFNLAKFGMLTPMQEAVKNRADGKTIADYADAATQLNWWHELSRRYLRHSLWRGGWSQIMPEWKLLGINRLFVKIHEYLIYASIAGAAWFALSRKRRTERGLLARPETGWRVLVLWMGVSAGLCYHMLHTYVALPNVATNIWYAALTFPWLLVLFAQGVAALPSRFTGIVCMLLMALVYVATEVYGTLIAMVPRYTGVVWGNLAQECLNTLHPIGPDANWTLPTLAAMLVCVSLALMAAAMQPCGYTETMAAEHDGTVAPPSGQ